MSIMGQAQTQVLQNIEKIQNKVLRILNFKNPWEPIEQKYKESKMFKLKDIVTISNLKFVYDQMNKLLPRVFEKNLLIKPDNMFIIQEETPLMFRKLKQQLTVPPHSHYLQFVHGISFKTNSAPLGTSLPNLTPTKFLKVIKTYISEKP